MIKLSDLSLEMTESPVPEETASIRSFTLWEMTEYLFSVSLSHLRRLLRTEERLPIGSARAEGATREFTAEDVWAIGQHLNRSSLGKGLCIGVIGRQPQQSAQVSALLAVRSALAGFTVTALDMGPAGDLTRRCAGNPSASTPAGERLLARSAVDAHRRINQRRTGLGEPPLALPLGLDPDAETDITPHPSPWPGLSLLSGGQTTGHSLDWALWQRLIPQWTGREAFASLTVPAGGLLICDLGSEPSPLMMAGLEKTDLLLVIDEGDSSEWFACLQARLELQEKAEAESAKALGTTLHPLAWTAVRRIPLDGAPTFGAALLPPLPAAALPEERTVWDILPRSMPRAQYVQLRSGPEAFWTAVEALLRDISAT